MACSPDSGHVCFKDARRHTRVDNQCKASLDGLALQLEHDSSSKLLIVGYADTAEAARGKNVESIRAANARDYLTKGEGKQQIDPSRIEIRKSTDRNSGGKVQIYLVPPNAAGLPDNTEVIDESTLPAKRRS